MSTPLAVANVPASGPEWAQARRRARFSQTALAAKVGVSRRTIENLEVTGRNVHLAIRRVVAQELWMARGWQDPFTPTAEEAT